MADFTVSFDSFRRRPPSKHPSDRGVRATTDRLLRHLRGIAPGVALSLGPSSHGPAWRTLTVGTDDVTVRIGDGWLFHYVTYTEQVLYPVPKHTRGRLAVARFREGIRDLRERIATERTASEARSRAQRLEFERHEEQRRRDAEQRAGVQAGFDALKKERRILKADVTLAVTGDGDRATLALHVPLSRDSLAKVLDALIDLKVLCPLGEKT